MSNLELMNVLSKPWANLTDIKKIGYCGRDSASSIMNRIIYDINKSGKKLPHTKERLVPMDYVIKYFDLNVDNIYALAEKEKNLKSI